jgi:uncharacterized protein
MVKFRRNPGGPGRVIDRRGARGGLALGAGGGGLALVVALLVMFLGGGGSDLGGLVDALAPAPASSAEAPLDPTADPDADLVAFLGDVLADSQAMWTDIFERSDLDYRPTDLVVFSGATQSGCGGAYAQSGPHYCPTDGLVYLDIDFLRELQARFGAVGDAAQAYIVAHEVAHHVQNELGILADARNGGQDGAIALELQADCFAGVWFSTLRSGTSAAVLEDGDIREALDAAAAVGDDSIQRQTSGRVNPETWTHGSSEQRFEWLKRGLDSGRPDACDTFS